MCRIFKFKYSKKNSISPNEFLFFQFICVSVILIVLYQINSLFHLYNKYYHYTLLENENDDEENII